MTRVQKTTREYSFRLVCGQANTCETKGDQQSPHLLGGALHLPWWEEVSGLVCGPAVAATVNSSLSRSHITRTQNPFVWFLAPAESYHNTAEVWSGSHRSVETQLHCVPNPFNKRNYIIVWTESSALPKVAVNGNQNQESYSQMLFWQR